MPCSSELPPSIVSMVFYKYVQFECLETVALLNKSCLVAVEERMKELNTGKWEFFWYKKAFLIQQYWKDDETKEVRLHSYLIKTTLASVQECVTRWNENDVTFDGMYFTRWTQSNNVFMHTRLGLPTGPCYREALQDWASEGPDLCILGSRGGNSKFRKIPVLVRRITFGDRLTNTIDRIRWQVMFDRSGYIVLTMDKMPYYLRDAYQLSIDNNWPALGPLMARGALRSKHYPSTNCAKCAIGAAHKIHLQFDLNWQCPFTKRAERAQIVEDEHERPAGFVLSRTGHLQGPAETNPWAGVRGDALQSY